MYFIRIPHPSNIYLLHPRVHVHFIPLFSQRFKSVHVIIELGFMLLTNTLSILGPSWSLFSCIILSASIIHSFCMFVLYFKQRRHLLHPNTWSTLQTLKLLQNVYTHSLQRPKEEQR